MTNYQYVCSKGENLIHLCISVYVYVYIKFERVEKLNEICIIVCFVRFYFKLCAAVERLHSTSTLVSLDNENSVGQLYSSWLSVTIDLQECCSYSKFYDFTTPHHSTPLLLLLLRCIIILQ